MTVVSNDPSLWPLVNWIQIFGYSIVVSSVVVIYDWALTFGQEVELIWMQHWSLMTLLYVGVRYVGILYSVVYILMVTPVSITDQGCNIISFTTMWMPVVMNAMLGVIMMTRIHAMYQRSQTMLILLAVVLLASTIATGIMTVIANLGASGEEAIISGHRACTNNTAGLDLVYESLIPTAVWEILAFCLAVWIVIKRFRELRQSTTGSTIGGCFTVLTKSHAFYFLAFVVVTCFSIGSLSPNITDSYSVGAGIYAVVLQTAQGLQMFVLGPRLILSVRQYNAKLVARSDEGTAMTSIAFQAGRDSLTGEDV